MIVLTVITMIVAALVFLVYLAINPTKIKAPAANLESREHSRFNNSRLSFIVAIVVGYFLAGISAITGFVVLEGIDGFSAGAFMLLASPIYAIPVLLMAATVGYPIYRFCRKDSVGFPAIWLAFSAAAVISAMCTALLTSIVIFQLPDTIAGVAGFMCMASLVVAFPSALFTWARQRGT